MAYIFSNEAINNDNLELKSGEVTFVDEATNDISELENAGKVTRLKTDFIDNTDRKFNEAFERYKSNVQDILNTKDPTYTNAKKLFEIDKLIERRNEELDGIKNDYKQEYNKRLEEAKRSEALHYYAIDDVQRDRANQKLNEFNKEVKNDESRAFEMFQTYVEAIDFEELSVLQNNQDEIYNVVDQLNKTDSERTRMKSRISSLLNSKLDINRYAYQIAKQLPSDDRIYNESLSGLMLVDNHYMSRLRSELSKSENRF